MRTEIDIIALAKLPICTEDIRNILDFELQGKTFETDDLRLALASDLLCDAALEVTSMAKDEPTIRKVVALDGTNQMAFKDLAIVRDLRFALKSSIVSQQELDSLLLKSSVAHAISQALRAGESLENVTASEIKLIPLQFSSLLKKQNKKKGVFARLFGK